VTLPAKAQSLEFLSTTLRQFAVVRMAHAHCGDISPLIARAFLRYERIFVHKDLLLNCAKVG
jgi:hypothetical protein